jgi:histidinol phosphatase-like PHP family hydrolase
MICDFHTHSFFSDGELLPTELIRRAQCNGYRVIGITDHASMSNIAAVVQGVVEDCRLAEKHWGICCLPGVELTHVPAAAIAECARFAKTQGACLVVVHGETIVEPVEPGTNMAAVSSPDVDILAHPGFVTPDEARLAARNNIFLEITSRGGHSLTNGYVAAMAAASGAKLIIDSDTHAPDDLLTEPFARQVALGAGIAEPTLENVMLENPHLLLKKLGITLK